MPNRAVGKKPSPRAGSSGRGWQYHCLRCGHWWNTVRPRDLGPPRRCAWCTSPYWNETREVQVEARFGSGAGLPPPKFYNWPQQGPEGDESVSEHS